MLRRVLVVFALLATGYLVPVNVVLNLPLTQSLVNQFRPDRYAVSWEHAWSWYPFRVHARGITADGQTATQQWQASAPAASVDVALIPLLQRTVRLDDLVVTDLDLRVRPRPRADRDDATTRPFFPPIRGRDPAAAAEPPPVRDPRRAWRIAVRDARVTGRHDLWIRHVRGTLEGEATGDLDYRTRRGPLAVAGGAANVVLHALRIGDAAAVTRDGTVEGRFALAPFVPSEQRGWRSLAFLSADATVDLPVASLAFLDLYLGRFGGMRVDGAGRMSGRVAYDRGDLVSGTSLRVLADSLSVRVDGHQAIGAGDVGIAVDPATPKQLAVDIRFDHLEGRHRDAEVPLFTGNGLVIGATGAPRVLPDEMPGMARLTVAVPDVEVPDLRVYQRYLPSRWGLSLDGGAGVLTGGLAYSPEALEGGLRLLSSDVETAIRGHRFRGDLDLELRVRGQAGQQTRLDIAGTSVRLDDARALDGTGAGARPWSMDIAVGRGWLDVPTTGDGAGASGFGALARTLRGQGLAGWLSSADAEADLRLAVSDLGWIGTLFRNPYGMNIAGAGEASVGLRLSAGELAEGSRLEVLPSDLAVGVLDYVARGTGDLAVTVARGGPVPVLRLDAHLDDAWLRRSSEEQPMIEQVSLLLSALASGLVSRGPDAVEELRLRIPSARVTDMRVYNAYLPAGSPFSLAGGQANVAADVRLQPGSASGFVTLESDGLTAWLDEQQVAGRVRLDVRIRDGAPEDMRFDIAGSQLLLDRFRVSGEQGNFDQAGWGAGLRLDSGEVRWRKPVRLDLEAGIEMTDSRPIVALFANQRGENPFIQRLMTVEDVRGEARLHVADDEVRLPYALAGSDDIEVGAKGMVRDGKREGIFLARFRKLQGIVKLRDGARNIDLVGARKTFDAYVPGETPLAIRGTDRRGKGSDGTGTTPGSKPGYPLGGLDGL